MIVTRWISQFWGVNCWIKKFYILTILMLKPHALIGLTFKNSPKIAVFIQKYTKTWNTLVISVENQWWYILMHQKFWKWFFRMTPQCKTEFDQKNFHAGSGKKWPKIGENPIFWHEYTGIYQVITFKLFLVYFVNKKQRFYSILNQNSPKMWSG